MYRWNPGLDFPDVLWNGKWRMETEIENGEWRKKENKN